jgi:hypothetical protein
LCELRPIIGESPYEAWGRCNTKGFLVAAGGPRPRSDSPRDIVGSRR